MAEILPWLAVGIVMILALVVVAQSRLGQQPAQKPFVTDYDTIMQIVRRKLVERLLPDLDVNRPGFRRDLSRVVEFMIDSVNPLFNRAERDRMVKEIVDGMCPPED